MPEACAADDQVAAATPSVIHKLVPGQAPVIWVGSGDEGDADGRGRAASFSLPTGITRDRAGNLYVADLGSNRVRRVTPDGVVSTVPLQLPPGAALVGPIAVSDTTLAVAAGTQILKVPVPRLTAGQTP